MTASEICEKAKIRAKNAVRDISEKVKDGIQWVIENPEKAATLASIAAVATGGTTKLIKTVNRNVTQKAIEREKRTRIYDRSMNAYIYTKRPLTSEQINFINNERRRTGKRTSEILYEMGLLRK